MCPGFSFPSGRGLGQRLGLAGRRHVLQAGEEQGLPGRRCGSGINGAGKAPGAGVRRGLGVGKGLGKGVPSCGVLPRGGWGGIPPGCGGGTRRGSAFRGGS